MNTCDEAQGWTTSHCQDQDHPRLTVQNLTFADGNSTGEITEGGGAARSSCAAAGSRWSTRGSSATAATRPGPTWAAPRSACSTSRRASRCTSSTARSAGAGRGRRVLQRRRPEQHRRLVGGAQQRVHAQLRDRRRRQPGPRRHAGRRQRRGDLHRRQPVHRRIAGSIIEDNKANEGGGAVFFVSNDRTGTMRIESSTLRGNPSAGFETAGLPGHLLPRRRQPDRDWLHDRMTKISTAVSGALSPRNGCGKAGSGRVRRPGRGPRRPWRPHAGVVGEVAGRPAESLVARRR